VDVGATGAVDGLTGDGIGVTGASIGVTAVGVGATGTGVGVTGAGAAGVGADGGGADSVAADGAGAEGIRVDGVGAEGVGADGVDADGVGTDNVGGLIGDTVIGGSVGIMLDWKKETRTISEPAPFVPSLVTTSRPHASKSTSTGRKPLAHLVPLPALRRRSRASFPSGSRPSSFMGMHTTLYPVDSSRFQDPWNATNA
jgi:hypothetical protein